MSVDLINLWHQRARPHPDGKDFLVQMGCHFEEVGEMLEELVGMDEFSHTLLVKANTAINMLAEALKGGAAYAAIRDRNAFLDSLVDQIVTGVGTGHCANMDVVEATRRVNTSNWSKYDHEGKPIFDKNGKIVKGPNYQAPDLVGLY